MSGGKTHHRFTQNPLEFFSAGTGDDTRWQTEADRSILTQEDT